MLFLASWGLTFLLNMSFPLSQQGSARTHPESVGFSAVWDQGLENFCTSLSFLNANVWLWQGFRVEMDVYLF